MALRDMLGMIEGAWATPTIGRDLAYGLCDVIKERGGLEILIQVLIILLIGTHYTTNRYSLYY